MQLRDKSRSDRARLALAIELRALCARHDVPFVVNDRVDIAVLVSADGVHLGQDDLPLARARELCARLGVSELEIGVSTHDPKQARAAARGGADLIGFGPVFETASKESPDPVVGVDGLAAICAELDIAVAAIGGIDAARARDVGKTGARWGAAIGAVCGADDPEAAARALHRRLRDAP